MRRFIVIDDHPLVRMAIRLFLEKNGFEVVAETGDGGEVLPLVHLHQPDVLVIDINIPTLNGIEVINLLRKSKFMLPIIVMSSKNPEHYVLKSALSGANGFISKTNHLEDLIYAVNAVCSGYGYFPQQMYATQLMGAPADDCARIKSLSAREFEVLQYLAEGMEVIAIATRIKISHKTVSTHKYRMMEKLGLTSRKELLDFIHRN